MSVRVVRVAHVSAFESASEPCFPELSRTGPPLLPEASKSVACSATAEALIGSSSSLASSSALGASAKSLKIAARSAGSIGGQYSCWSLVNYVVRPGHTCIPQECVGVHPSFVLKCCRIIVANGMLVCVGPEEDSIVSGPQESGGSRTKGADVCLLARSLVDTRRGGRGV